MSDFDQPGLFGDPSSAPKIPPGFKYQPNFITEDEEQHLLRDIRPLPFKEFQFQGYTGKRRVISFGWRYDFNERELQHADDMPEFVQSLRKKAAAFANLAPADLQHVLITEYAAGAAIGWHRDKAVFDQVVGISLVSPCPFRFRRQVGTKWERITITAEPRSAYLLTGPSRTQWEHSIPPVQHLRYSITFRSFKPTPPNS